MKVNPLLRSMPPAGARMEMLNQAHLAKIYAKARFKRYSMRALNTPGWSHWGRSLMPISYRIGRRREVTTAQWRTIRHTKVPF